MARFALTRDQAIRAVAEVERALADGHSPIAEPGTLGNNIDKGATRIAAERLGVDAMTARQWFGFPDRPGRIFKHFGIAVDWTKYQPAPKPVLEVPSDPIDLRRLKDDNALLRNALREAQRRAATAENIRGEVLGLRDLPDAPVAFPARDKGSSKAETVVLMLSDLHWGETVSLDAMDGMNSYSPDIAAKRLGRWTHTVIDLLTKHWAGPKPARIILILGGDLVSGSIHHELAKTDALRPLPAVRDVASHLRHAILTIKANVDCRIEIISLPGNHGRSTLKPESKEAAATSHDILVSDFLEMGLRDAKGIRFLAPLSPDALFSVYGFRILASHGDKIGSRGGTGFIGPAATAARGMKRMIADYAARGVHVDLILIGHFHSRLLLDEGFVNGSLIGPSEFSRDGRYRPQPAMQLFLTIHPKRIIAQMRWIEVGDPSEGSLYQPPPPDAPPSPRFAP